VSGSLGAQLQLVRATPEEAKQHEEEERQARLQAIHDAAGMPCLFFHSNTDFDLRGAGMKSRVSLTCTYHTSKLYMGSFYAETIVGALFRQLLLGTLQVSLQSSLT